MTIPFFYAILLAKRKSKKEGLKFIIYFVRHGHPYYKNDCLTEMGKKQAEAASERLCTYGIEEIYSSTNGRAYQTAEYTANKLSLDITPCDFMREIKWSSLTGEPVLCDGHPWYAAMAQAGLGISLRGHEWQKTEPYSKTKVVKCVTTVIEGFDALFRELGYTREGEYYRVTGDNTDKKIAIFSHGGSSSAVLSHLLNIPFPLFCATFHLSFTSITAIELPNEKGTLVNPRALYINDSIHIKGISSEQLFGN